MVSAWGLLPFKRPMRRGHLVAILVVLTVPAAVTASASDASQQPIQNHRAAAPRVAIGIVPGAGLAPGATIRVTVTGRAGTSGSAEAGVTARIGDHPVRWKSHSDPCKAQEALCSAVGTVSTSGLAAGYHTLEVTATVDGDSTTVSSAFELGGMHIETWALDDSTSPLACDGGYGASPALVRAWLTIAETKCGIAGGGPALQDCHHAGVTYCTVVHYIDPTFAWTRGATLFEPLLTAGQSGGPAPEQWYVHSGSGCGSRSRVRFSSPSFGATDLLYQGDGRRAGGDENPCWKALGAPYEPFADWLDAYANSKFGRWNGLMVDDMGLTFSPSYEELPTQADSVSEHRFLASQLVDWRTGTHFLQVDNSWSSNPYQAPPTALYDDRDGVRGMIMEGAPWSSEAIGDPYTITPDANGHPAPWIYENVLDSMAWVDHNTAPSDFLVLLSYDPGNYQNPLAPGNQLRGRLLQEATVLLGYEPRKIVDWADLENPEDHLQNQSDPDSEDLAIWPEEGVYPTDPVQSMGDPHGTGCLTGHGPDCTTGGHNDLRVMTVGSGAYPSGGYVYRREFRQCFNRGAPIGPCAALVNDSGTQETVLGSWLTQPYRYVLTPEPGASNNHGWDVQSGGWVNTCGQRNAPVPGQSFTAGSTTIAPWSAIVIDYGPTSRTCRP